MALVTGFNHIATLTKDLDRLHAFYRDVFGAEMVMSETMDGGPGYRHAMFEVGEAAVLHAFEATDVDIDAWGASIFRRGRIDHYALTAPDAAAFGELRGRLVERGASDGTVTDFGAALSVHFTDPDGTHLEVVCMKPGVPWSEGRTPAGYSAPTLET